MAIAESAQALLASSGPQSAAGAGGIVDLGPRDRLLSQALSVTAASGATPTLDVFLEASADADGASGWRRFGQYLRATAPSVRRVRFIAPERYVRVAWQIGGGSPSFTFAVNGTKDTVYANLDDFNLKGIRTEGVRDISQAVIIDALVGASEKANGKLGLAVDLPLNVWQVDLVEAVCKIAAFDALSYIGFNPEGGADSNIRTRHDDAQTWLRDVAAGRTKLLGYVDQTPDVVDDGVVLASNQLRGWGCR